MNKRLFGCIAKDGEEIDGQEFKISTLKELVELLEDVISGRGRSLYLIKTGEDA